MVIVTARQLLGTAAAYTGPTSPLPHGRRMTLSVSTAVPHEIRVQHNDPQTTLSLFDGVIATCKRKIAAITSAQYQQWVVSDMKAGPPLINRFRPPFVHSVLPHRQNSHLVQRSAMPRTAARSAIDQRVGESSMAIHPRVRAPGKRTATERYVATARWCSSVSYAAGPPTFSATSAINRPWITRRKN